MSWINAAGNPQDVRYPLGALLYRPDAEAPDADVRDHVAHEAMDAPAVLLELSDLPDAATAGDELAFNWTWRKREPHDADLSARLLWLDEAGAIAGSSPALPLVHSYDFGSWRSGEIFRGHHSAILPADLAEGPYQLAIALADAAGERVGSILNLERTMEVRTPLRRFDAPEFDVVAEATWENGIVLQGYSLSEEGAVELVWSNERLLSESLRLFVHALDDQGLIAAQWDGVPADWTRPTTGWLPGEYVTTRHAFAVPAGEYALRVGWYRPASGARIALDGHDSLLLDHVLVID